MANTLKKQAMAEAMQIRKISTACGAEVTGVNATQPLNFGPLEAHVIGDFAPPGRPEIFVVSNVKEEGKPGERYDLLGQPLRHALRAGGLRLLGQKAHAPHHDSLA